MQQCVATFEAQTNAKLRDAINAWLNRENITITDVRYAIYPGHYTAYCALIIYRKEHD